MEGDPAGSAVHLAVQDLPGAADDMCRDPVLGHMAVTDLVDRPGGHRRLGVGPGRRQGERGAVRAPGEVEPAAGKVVRRTGPRAPRVVAEVVAVHRDRLAVQGDGAGHRAELFVMDATVDVEAVLTGVV